jgi:hypothetical protein
VRHGGNYSLLSCLRKERNAELACDSPQRFIE